ncbi:DNA segregation ATPase FtsK/SpoIIIE, S-DNA-T family [Amycolatopsis saalfeldensis]|uniref:DNA segregation ATPase FtsK/SpoIIIE, S-DNA-T family n=1 Tax=Amycolatopsis saalfeldensis TaxID=394193 RepID=A0A1H8YJX4_9PSEU|nr:DNA segregation ATPase FtsK/SpoIIIE, S-DNA-T family [Amycolatopsis saalfeldensis]
MPDPSPRQRGWEVKLVLWMVRHPVMVAVPAVIVIAGQRWGWSAVAVTAAGLAVVTGCWYRGHPDTFDQYAGPYLRAWCRRWSSYIGPRWRHALRACELSITHRKTREEKFPRITRIRSYSTTVDTLHLRIVAGQQEKHFEAKSAELAHALRVQRVSVEVVKPGVIGLHIQRREPFTKIIPAPDMPQQSSTVDLKRVYVGETEYGQEWRIPILGGHLFVAGATGAGKNSIPLALMRSLAPLIRDGLVRLWVCDPKLFEFASATPICYRYADTAQSCADLIADYLAEMQAVQRDFADRRIRRLSVSRETPINVLIVDEMAALMAYGDYAIAKQVRGHLALVGSQGRASGHTMIGMVQEPTKDTISIRDLFTWRICLRLTASNHVDGVLGEDSRARGARADEIPDLAETAGIGYVVRPRSRLPIRVRAAYVDDTHIAELVRFITESPQWTHQ